MAKSRLTLRARVTQPAGRRRKKKSTNPVQRAFDELKQLVSDTADRAATRQNLVKKTGERRVRGGRQRQAAAKQAGTSRIQSGRQRQSEARKAVRTRRAKSS